ncbi:senecionine N-oxygenase-like [Anopheles marshallii]|uniref:senecionine N-oxygenase-like n=1 Tax=Anopheles marshallii TaxID=1521116 RepID=UPI00237A3888|nr:senecionine N-oxygenase-like [Anopheles marshallii]
MSFQKVNVDKWVKKHHKVFHLMAPSTTYCIIGAGPSGLCTAKHALTFDHNATVKVFEQSQKIGGLWAYSEKTGKDVNGLDITCMYANLRTNLIKHGMGYPDYPIDEQAGTFVTISDVIKQLEGYVDKFQLKKYIYFQHQVVRVVRNFESSQWNVLVKDLASDQFTMHQFDFVLVCNGHYSSPIVPSFPGRSIFRGRQLHSKDYRRGENYRGERVLVIGGGHSGMDIAPDIAVYADKVVLSHRCKVPVHTGDHVVQKPEVARLTLTGAEFVDGTEEHFDTIIYCTGYRYSTPFLSVDCGVSLHDNAISPLYYHCININQPTMAFIGLPFNACLMLMMDLQARFCMTFFSGQKPLPSKQEMLDAWQQDQDERKVRGLTGKLTHMLAGDLQQRYYDDVAHIAGIESLKPVLAKMHADCINSKNEDVNFRNFDYHIIDDENFIKVKIPPKSVSSSIA